MCDAAPTPSGLPFISMIMCCASAGTSKSTHAPFACCIRRTVKLPGQLRSVRTAAIRSSSDASATPSVSPLNQSERPVVDDAPPP